MATNFMNMKRNTASLETYNKKIQDLNSGGFAKDERYWSPVQDKAGNGSAVIRFLPPAQGEDFPFVRLFHYGIKGNGWYIENSLATLGQADPASELYFKYKNSGNEAMANKLSRRMSFIANIMVVDHPARPEDNGKVFLYKFGKKIFDKLQDKMTPPLPTMKPMDPFDFWTGANFVLIVTKVQDFNNYDKSTFESAGPLLDDDAALEAVWQKQYPLSPEIAPDKFKSYQELEKKLFSVLGVAGNDAAPEQQQTRVQTAPQTRPTQEAIEKKATPPQEPEGGDFTFFKNLTKNRPGMDDEISF